MMRKSLLRFAMALLATGGSWSGAYAIDEQADYAELFENLGDASAADFAPGYWLHYVDKGTSADPWYAAENEGGHDEGAYLRVTDKCNPYYMTDDCLVTPPVKGEVSFWVKGKTLSLYKMDFNGSTISKGTSVSLPSGFKVNQDEWQQVTLSFDSYTRVGILFRLGEGGLDDFRAEYADLSAITYLTVSGITYDKKVVADVTGHAVVNVAFTLANKGTAPIDLAQVSFVAGKTNYLGDAITEAFMESEPMSGTLAAGESRDVMLEVPVALADAEKSESVTLGVQCSLNGAIYKIGSVDVRSIAGVLGMRTSSAELQKEGTVECDVQRGEYTHVLYATNSGESDIVISNVTFGGNLADVVSAPALPYTLAPGETKKELPLTFNGTPGGKCGTVTLVYSDGISTDKEFTFTLSAGIVTADGWLEDFQSVSTPDLPKGWMVGEGSFRTATYQSYDPRVRANSDSYSKSSLITSLMHLDSNGTLTLMGGRQSVSDSHDRVLTVWYSTDRENWEELGGVIAKQPAGRLPFNTFVASQKANEMTWYNFSLRNVETGDYYIKFEAQPFSLDNIFGVEPVAPLHDMLLSAISAPAKGEVNKLLTASVEVSNMKADAESDYVVTLYSGDTAVAYAEGVEIDGYSKATIELSYMPHAEGETELHAEVNVADGFRVLKSSAVTVDVAAEECVGKAQSASIDKFSSDGLVSAKFNKVQFYIPADDITLAEGTEISEIAFSVYNSSSYGSATVPYNLWIEEVDAVTPFTEEDKIDFALPEGEMNATGSYTLQGGSGSADSPEAWIIGLDKPVTFTGKSLMVTMEMNLSSTTYSFYVGMHNYADNLKRSYAKNTETGSFPGGKLLKEVPVVTLRYAQAPAAVTGRILSEGAPVSGATVRLTQSAVARAIDAHHASVSYEATTDGAGAFSIGVIKSGTYALSAMVGDYKYLHPAEVALAGNDVNLNDVEIGKLPTGLDAAEVKGATIRLGAGTLTIAGADGEVYNIAGVHVAHAAADEAVALGSGVYVVRIAGNDKATKVIIR